MRRIIISILLTFSFFFFNINIGIAPLGSKTSPHLFVPQKATNAKIILNGLISSSLQLENLNIPSLPQMKPSEEEVQCLGQNIYFEAAVESTAGKVAVAYVTLNRVSSAFYPNTICEVVKQARHHKNGFPIRDRCQFSWYCDGKSDVPRPGNLWEESQRVAKVMIQRHLNSQLLDITDGSTHYHANWMEEFPRWSTQRKKLVSIDQHIFYGARL
jgi:spore germination cell wall hydrolase CwlJ-like protein